MLPCYKNTYCLAAALPLAIQTTTLMADTNLTGPSGGDSRTSLLAPYRTLKPQFSLPVTQSAEMNAQFDRGDIAWIYSASVFVWVMIPAIGFLYAGLARRHHSLSLVWQSLISVAVVTFQWFFWGYSLTFSHSAGPFIGDLANFGSKGVLAQPSVGSALIPDILFYLFQLVFSCATAMIMVGGAMERGRLIPSAIFIFIWTTVVYDPIACWTWNSSGWLFKLGSLDFAGGGPVHMSSGAGALAYALVLGKRTGPVEGGTTRMPRHKPSNVFLVVLGTVLLWFGWFGFNGGSALNASLRAIYAGVNTNLAAACGAMTFCALDVLRHKKRWSMVGLCCGAVAGLVGITPASGFIPIYFAVPVGVVTGLTTHLAMDLKDILRIDDGLDVFALHGIGGLTGNVLTGLFAADYITALDGYSSIPGGWLNGNYIQLAYQLAGCAAILSYSFTVTALLLLVMDRIPGLRLRVSEEEETGGLDVHEIGEAIMEYGMAEVLEAGAKRLNEEKKEKEESPRESAEKEGETE
ncbi:ammonium transporter AmtB-like domain-containing protein [Mycena leptocephala]|nr:ammonium transporter AmtB-like domain-containing protein [Mycena leptocephala]